jgi:hypothetical protein
VPEHARSVHVDAVAEPTGKLIQHLRDVPDAISHAERKVWMGAGRGPAVVAGKQLDSGFIVDEVDPHVILAVVDVVGGGHHETSAGDQLQRVSVIDRIVQIAV